MHPNAHVPTGTPDRPTTAPIIMAETASAAQSNPAPPAEGNHRRSKGRASQPVNQPEPTEGA